MSAHSLRSDVLRLRRGRPAWAVPLLLFLAVLIVAALAFNLANLDTGDETAPPTSGGTAPASSLFAVDPAVVDLLLVVFGSLFIGAMIYVILTNRTRHRRPTKRSSWWEVLASVLGLALVLALLFAMPRMVRTLQSGNTTADSTSGTTGAGDLTAWPAAVGAPLGLFLAFTVLVTILALTSFLRRSASAFAFDDDPSSKRDSRRTATEVVGAAIAELELGGDVRNAILACFQRFCRLLGVRGITEQTALTPRELERLAVERLRVSRDASATLTSLFEEARYSEHALREADRKRAIDSLEGIRAVLEA